MAQPAFALSSAPDRTWGTDGKTYALVKWGNTIFVGGTFKRAVGTNGQQVPSANIAAFDMTTGANIPSFAASVTNTFSTAKPTVEALAVSTDGSTLYIGGDFDTVNGQPRMNLAAVDTATGTQLNSTVTAQPDSPVQAIVAGPNLVYFGGNFMQVNGSVRNHLAAISATDGTLSSYLGPLRDRGDGSLPQPVPAGDELRTRHQRRIRQRPQHGPVVGRDRPLRRGTSSTSAARLGTASPRSASPPARR